MVDQADRWNRRTFLRGIAVGGAVGLAGLPAKRAVAEPSPETTTIRLYRALTAGSGICVAPQWVGEDLLKDTREHVNEAFRAGQDAIRRGTRS